MRYKRPVTPGAFDDSPRRRRGPTHGKTQTRESGLTGQSPEYRVALSGPRLYCDALASLLHSFDRPWANIPVSCLGTSGSEASSHRDLWLVAPENERQLFLILAEATSLKTALQNAPAMGILLVVPGNALWSGSDESGKSVKSADPKVFSETMCEEMRQTESLLRAGGIAGIQAFVSVHDAPSLLQTAIRAVASGEPYCSPRLLPLLLGTLRSTSEVEPLPSPASPPEIAAAKQTLEQLLTERERGVAALAARGLTNEEIAAELFLSVNTIKSHLKQIFRKGGLTCRTQLAAHWLSVPNATVELSSLSSGNAVPERRGANPLAENASRTIFHPKG